jgi:tRNA pseudouridine55 synthase
MESALMAEEFALGKILLFDKPLYWTSFDLVRKIKGILKNRLDLKKLKVGHAGTLDPLATGLMIVCTGKETKNIEKYQAEFKEYKAVIMLGATTPSFDLETNVDVTYPTEHITLANVERVINGLKGTGMQQPPDYSARFINGKRAYSLARRGEAVDLPMKEIEIRSIELIRFELPVIEFRVVCSKGTYVRSLARDIGTSLGSGAHLTGLVRTSIGSYLLKDAIKIEEFERNLVLL